MDGERREGTVGERDAIAERGWNRFVDGCQSYLAAVRPVTAGIRAGTHRLADGGGARRGSASAPRVRRASRRARVGSARTAHRRGCARHRPLAPAVGQPRALAQYTGGRVTLRTERARCSRRSTGRTWSKRGCRRRCLRSSRPLNGSRCTRAPEKGSPVSGRGRRAAQHALADRVRAGVVLPQAGGSRARAGLSRYKDLHPRTGRSGS